VLGNASSAAAAAIPITPRLSFRALMSVERSLAQPTRLAHQRLRPESQFVWWASRSP
jgi:hypothetical protein